MRKYFVIMALLLAVLFNSYCDKSEVTPEVVINYMGVAATCYNVAMPVIVAVAPADKHDQICKINDTVRESWRLAVLGLQVYLENKGAKGASDVIVNLNSFRVALNTALTMAKVDDKTKAYVEGGISAAQTIVTVLMPRVRFGSDYVPASDLSGLAITFDCNASDKDITGSKDVNMFLSKIPDNLKTDELRRLEKIK